MVVLGNADSVDMSEFVVPAMQTLIPLIFDQLSIIAPPPVSPPNATLLAGSVYSGVDSTGESGVLSVVANTQGALMVYDSRLPSGVAYQLSYLSNITTPNTLSFQVQIVSTNVIGAAELTCLNIVESGAQNDVMEFSEPTYVGYNTLLFQGELYMQLDIDYNILYPNSG